MDVATAETVRGDFDDAEFTYRGVTSRFYQRDGKFYVYTEGPGGEMGEFEITHVFGHEPLQQYMTPFPGGRLQVLSVTWDAEKERWYRQYPGRDIDPDDWLHWTRGAQTWNAMCAECHSTNLQKNYDPATDSYDTTWSDIDVGCEACHGPGSQHVAWAQFEPARRPDDPNIGLVVDTSPANRQVLVDQCAPCHSHRAEIADYAHQEGDLLNYMLPSLLSEALYHTDGQIKEEVYVYGSFLQSKMHAQGVICRDCHDSHSLKLRAEGNALCIRCHDSNTYDRYEHHFHQKVVDGRPSEGALCVKCHMVERPFMVIDWRADHSFRVPRPDLSAAIGTPNACTDCHADQTVAWANDAYGRWYGQQREPHFASAFGPVRDGDPNVRPALVRLAGVGQPVLVRATALELIARDPDEAGFDALLAALDADASLVRRTAVEYLPLRSPDDVRRVAKMLTDDVLAVRISAASRLAGAPAEMLTAEQSDALQTALAEYRAAMAYSLDFASSNHNLGNLEYALGNVPVAEAYYRRALRIDDLFSPAKANLAVVLSGQGRLAESEQLLREILRDYPDDADAMYSLGLLLVETERPEDGVVMLTRAAAAQPKNPRMQYNLGLLLQQLGRLDEAEQSLRHALDLAPQGLDYLHAYADHLYRRDRLSEARAIAERLIEHHPAQPIGHQLRSAIDARLRR